MFATYYNRLNDGQSIYAVNTNGTTITIGKKNEEGDIFFERQLEETEVEEVQDETIDDMDPDTWWANKDEIVEEDNVVEDEE